MKTAKAAEPTITRDLTPERTACPPCGRPMWADSANRRTVRTPAGVSRLDLTIRRCRHAAGARHEKPYRPEAEGAVARPRHEFGLDVIALIGRLRYTEHRSVPEIRAHLVGRAASVPERTVTNLPDRYDELLAAAPADDRRLKKVLAPQENVILARDGLQPDVGHEVLWVLRDVLGGEIRLAKSRPSARNRDRAAPLGRVKASCPVPVAGVVSDGPHATRKAVAAAFPGVPHQRCQFHDLREAARPVYEAGRQAEKNLEKKARGVRKVERAVEGRADPAADAARGYGSAVRSAPTDDGRPPLEASGLEPHGRLGALGGGRGRAGKGAARPRGRSGRRGPAAPARLPGVRSRRRTGRSGGCVARPTSRARSSAPGLGGGPNGASGSGPRGVTGGRSATRAGRRTTS